MSSEGHRGLETLGYSWGNPCGVAVCVATFCCPSPGGASLRLPLIAREFHSLVAQDPTSPTQFERTRSLDYLRTTQICVHLRNLRTTAPSPMPTTWS